MATSDSDSEGNLVVNDGNGIDIEKHPESNMYSHGRNMSTLENQKKQNKTSLCQPAWGSHNPVSCTADYPPLTPTQN